MPHCKNCLVNKNNYNSKPWLSKGILISIKTKHKLLQNMIKTKIQKTQKTISKI